MTGARWLKELYDAHFSMLFRLAVNRLARGRGNVEDAADVVQDVFRLALEKDISTHPNPVGWLIKTTENVCKNYVHRYLDEVRRSAPMTMWEGEESSPLQIPVASDEGEADVYMTMYSCLTEEERHIIEAYCIEDNPAEMLALQYGISKNALHVRIFRIKKKLWEFYTIHV